MIKSSRVVLSVLLIVLLSSATAMAVVDLGGRIESLVDDRAGVISKDAKEYLSTLLPAFRGKDFGGTEIVITTFDSSPGMTFDQFMNLYALRWRRPSIIESDNRVHIVLMVKDKEVRMGVGRYLQEIMPPAVANYIISEIIMPEVKVGDYDSAMIAGVEAVIRVVEGAKLPRSRLLSNARVIFYAFISLVVISAIFLFVRLRYKKF